MRTRQTLSTCALVVAVAVNAGAQRGAAGGQWRAHSGDLGSTKYAPLDQIARDNVSKLRIAWRRPAVEASLVANEPNVSYSHDFRATARGQVVARSAVRDESAGSK